MQFGAGGEIWTPTWSPTPDPKSGPSTNSGTPAYQNEQQISMNILLEWNFKIKLIILFGRQMGFNQMEIAVYPQKDTNRLPVTAL